MLESLTIMTGNDFADWLEKKYLEWQMEHGRASIRSFAKWLGINHVILVNLMNAKGRPGPKTLPILAEKLGYEVYDVLGLPRPDEREAKLIRRYRAIPPELRDEFSLALEEFIDAWAEHHGFEPD